VWLWQLLHVCLLVWSLGNKAEKSLWLWASVAVIFFAVAICTVGFVAYNIVVQSIFTWASGLGAILLYAVVAALHGQLRPVIISAPFYILAIPLFSILIPICEEARSRGLKRFVGHLPSVKSVFSALRHNAPAPAPAPAPVTGPAAGKEEEVEGSGISTRLRARAGSSSAMVYSPSLASRWPLARRAVVLCE
jgi:hypothetical protein